MQKKRPAYRLYTILKLRNCRTDEDTHLTYPRVTVRVLTATKLVCLESRTVTMA